MTPSQKPEGIERFTIYVCPRCNGREIAPPYGGPCPGCGSSMPPIEVIPVSDHQERVKELEEAVRGLVPALEEALERPLAPFSHEYEDAEEALAKARAVLGQKDGGA